MPVVTILQDSQSTDNNETVGNPKYSNNDISNDEILDLLSAMNGERGYAESFEAWAAWDALTRSADKATRTRMLEACRVFAQRRASVLRNGAA